MTAVAKLKPYLLLGLAVLFLAALHLARPNRNPNAMRLNVGPVTYAFDLDTQTFVWLTLTFPNGLATEEGKIRRDRPGYPALGWAAWQVLKPFRPLLPGTVVSRMRDKLAQVRNPAMWKGADARDLVAVWGGLILVNLTLYWLAAGLLYTALRTDFEPAVAFTLSLLPLTHYNSIDFLLVPHTEPFNMLMPALFLVALQQWRKEAAATATAAVTGLAALAKSFPVGAVGWLVEMLRHHREPRRLAWLGASFALVFFPGVLYVLLLRAVGVEPYSYSVVVMRNVVWIGDAWQEGRAATIPGTLLAGMGTHLLHSVWSWAVVLVSIAALLAIKPRRPFPFPRMVALHLTVYWVVNLVFWAIINYHSARLSVVEYPPLLVLLGVLAARRAPRPALWIGATLAVQLTAWSLGFFDPLQVR